MTVQNLITELSKMPQDAEIIHLKGAPKTRIGVNYQNKKGESVTSEYLVMNFAILDKKN